MPLCAEILSTLLYIVKVAAGVEHAVLKPQVGGSRSFEFGLELIGHVRVDKRIGDPRGALGALVREAYLNDVAAPLALDR